MKRVEAPRGVMSIFIRLCSAVLSSFLICYTMAWINTVPQSEQLPDVYYYSFKQNFWFPFVFSTLIYLIAAVPYSLFVDRKLQYLQPYKYLKEIVSIVLYVLGGWITLNLFFALTGGSLLGFVRIESFALGGGAAFLYYLIFRALEYLWYRIIRNRLIKSREA